MKQPRLITLKEAAELAAMSPQTLMRRIHEGLVRAYQMGTHSQVLLDPYELVEDIKRHPILTADNQPAQAPGRPIEDVPFVVFRGGQSAGARRPYERRTRQGR
ncbi:MAG: hypothetical protein C4575_09500 [Desulforudis sp.]|jgi:hypothetical protein|nr:MAG: hypothetical protein C4575_09500 [Desulforudis sp.]